MTDPADVLLTCKEFAELFRLTTRAVHKAIREGRVGYPVEKPLGGMAFIRVPAALVARLKAA